MPDLSDSSGGLSNPVFFNFVYYILWKVWLRPQLVLSKCFARHRDHQTC